MPLADFSELFSSYTIKHFSLSFLDFPMTKRENILPPAIGIPLGFCLFALFCCFVESGSDDTVQADLKFPLSLRLNLNSLPPTAVSHRLGLQVCTTTLEPKDICYFDLTSVLTKDGLLSSLSQYCYTDELLQEWLIMK